MTPRAEGADLVFHSCLACQLGNQKVRNKVAYLSQQIQFRHRWNELVFIFHPCLVAGPNNSFQLFRQFLWDGCEFSLNIHLQSTQKFYSVFRKMAGIHLIRLNQYIFTLVQSLPWTEGGSKPSSPLAIAKHCRLNGIPCPPTKTEDDAGFDLWESTYREKFPWVLGAGMWRSLNKLATTLKTIETRLRPDGTIDFSLFYFGGHVGQRKLRGSTDKIR